MHYLHLDIETLPTSDPDEIARLVAEIEAPSNYKDPDKIAAYRAEKAASVVAKTSLDGAVGRVCCIGFAVGDDDVSSWTIADNIHGDEDEKTLLNDFFASVAERVKNREPAVCVVGHRVADFDLRFILQRAIVLDVKLPDWFPRNPKPWSSEVFDTMTAFAGGKGTISQDKLCRSLGLAGKGDVDGSQVAGLWAEGKYEVVREYCADDVRRQREAFRRIHSVLGGAL
jgi:DNA polymerase elongation subunit (family B)